MLSEILVALLILILSLIYLFIKLDKQRKDLAHVPGPKPLPILGNALELGQGYDFYKQVNDLARKYGPIYNLMMGVKGMVVVSGAKEAEEILAPMTNLKKGFGYVFLQPWLKFGLLTSYREKWRVRRKMLTPTFHFKILGDFLNVMNEQCDVMMSRLEKDCDKGPIDILPYITHCALDIICETAMGRKVHAQEYGGENEYTKAIYSMTIVMMKRAIHPWLQYDAIFNWFPEGAEQKRCLNILHGFTRKVIEERSMELFKDGDFDIDIENENEDLKKKLKTKRLAFLDLLLVMAKRSGLSHDDIQEEVDTFMFEGHDTTTSAMNWAVHNIGSHPDVQKRLQDEVDQVFGDSDRAATMDDLRELKYLDQVLKESARVFPSVPWIARELEEDTMIGGKLIPKGVTVSILITAMHKDPNVFPEPEKFDPERFTSDEMAKRHPFAFIPFSAGPRNCIGQKFALNEEKVIISSILRRFNLKSIQKTSDLKPEIAAILRPVENIMVKFTRRR